MKRRIPVLIFLVIVIAGIIAGYAWRNYLAGLLLGLGLGLIVMVLARFFLAAARKKEVKPEPPSTGP